MRSLFPAAVLLLLAMTASGGEPRTVVTIEGDAFHINGRPTYAGRIWRGYRVEGLLLNARLVQGIFDDRNPETSGRWAYPDTGRWDPDRNTREFLAAMPEWRRHGLLCVHHQPAGRQPRRATPRTSPGTTRAFEADGSLRPDYLRSAGADPRPGRRAGHGRHPGLLLLRPGRAAARRGGRAARHGRRYLAGSSTRATATCWSRSTTSATSSATTTRSCAAARPRADRAGQERCGVEGRRLLVGTSFGGGTIPTANVVARLRFPAHARQRRHGTPPHRRDGRQTRARARLSAHAHPLQRGRPLRLRQGLRTTCSRPWPPTRRGATSNPGERLLDGYQCPPVNWTINTPRKRAFFERVREIAGLPGR